MAALGSMVCEACGHWGPQLLHGEGMNFVRELRRCKRCSGLVDVPVMYRDFVTHEWREQSGRGRCGNELPWSERAGDHDGDGPPLVCGSQALRRLDGDAHQRATDGGGDAYADQGGFAHAGAGQHDADPVPAGDRPDGDLTQPCPRCAGTMRFEMSAISD